MTVSELDKQIKPNMRGAYLFYGEEEYLKFRYREKMRAALLEDESLAPFNHSIITDITRLAGEVDTFVRNPPTAAVTITASIVTAL